MSNSKEDEDNDDLNILEMSDDDFLKTDPSQFESNDDNKSDEDDDDNQNADSDDDSDDDQSDDDDQDSDDNQDDDDADNQDDKKSDDDGSDDDDDDDDSKDSDSDSDSDNDDTKKKQDTGELTDTQLTDIGRQVMSEFKANGATMKMKSVDDVIQLMQMGANYHKKMSGLKPSLKTLKLLENNGLLDPDKINYLIDLNLKKPEAIKQLLKDSKLDPMAIDLEDKETYVPDQHTVNDTELVLDEVLDSIKDSSSYDRTLTVLGDQWDDSSRKSIASEPEIIRTINTHMDNGIFDQIVDTVAYERSLGKLSGISDFEAYQRVGSYMNENNLFKNSNVSGQSENNKDHQDSQPRNDGSPDQGKKAERKNRKKAASSSRQRKETSKKDDKYNPLEMSDEEFIKLNKLNL